MAAPNHKMGNINSLIPSTIIEVIFSKLPFFNLPNCRLVCKECNNLISASKFDSQISISDLVFDRSHNLHCVEFDSKLFNSMRIVATYNLLPKLFSRGEDIWIAAFCNGLLLLVINEDSTGERQLSRLVCILNLMTNECFNLPESEPKKEQYYYGIGFSPKTKQYKIARHVVSDCSGTYGILIEIFTMKKSFEWTPIMFMPCHSFTEDHVYFDGGLYIVGIVDINAGQVVYHLDVESERIKEIPFPKKYGEFCKLGDVNGTLYLTSLVHLDGEILQVWRMGKDFSWIKTFVLPFFSLLGRSYDTQLINVNEHGEIFYLVDEKELLLYHPKSRIKKKLMLIYSVHQIRSLTFNSLPKILAANC